VPTAKEVEQALAILLGGKIAAETAKGALATKRAVQVEGLGATALRGGRFVGRQAITKNPYGIAALLAYEGYIHREEIANVADRIAENVRDMEPFPIAGPTPLLSVAATTKRRLSRANRAVKEGMKIMKAGGKATTGAPPGKLSRAAFKTVTKAAGLANPKTKSKIGKGKSMVKKLARRLRKWW
jgi:hypothetical protein